MTEPSLRYAEDLPEAVPPSRERLRGILSTLEQGLVERGLPLRIALLAALAGEHTLLVGPPGTAKSQLARRLHLAFADARYFERLLTRYTVPEELFGPLSIKALEEDRYERQTDGFLPCASIAFVDEVFKASSAILNALLTLLNEREFDNGPRREPCPLISVIGATNAVPEDAVGEAFLDRFLVRLPVAPVSGAAFAKLLHVAARPPEPPAAPVEALEHEALWRAAAAVQVGAEVAALLGEVRAHLAGEGLYVSDRRWVKVAWLLRVSAAAEGRDEVAIWDLWVLPWCTAPDAERQARVAAWLAARLGADGEPPAPRLARAVQAFEAQLEAERKAEEVDDGPGRAADVASEAARGDSAVALPAFPRRRRYGDAHVGARVRELDDLAGRVERHVAELTARQRDLARWRAQALWADGELAAGVDAGLASAVATVRALAERARRAREGFLALPRLAADPGTVPEPVHREPIEA